jgi:hypothetical protein
VGLRYNDCKLVLVDQREHGWNVWAEPMVTLRDRSCRRQTVGLGRYARTAPGPGSDHSAAHFCQMPVFFIS